MSIVTPHNGAPDSGDSSATRRRKQSAASSVQAGHKDPNATQSDSVRDTPDASGEPMVVDPAAIQTLMSAYNELGVPVELPRKEGAVGSIGRFQVIRRIGTGGMGVVLLAYDPQLEREVALKFLKPTTNSKNAIERFNREVISAAKIVNENVVRVYERGDHADSPFMVMEFVDGCTLDEHLKSIEQLEIRDCLIMCMQIMSGLASAHENEVIHRDVKPGNLLVDRKTKRIKITDFGLARTTLDDMNLTSESAVLGTPMYISPEQYGNNQDVTEKSDLFSAGCVIYRMLTGSHAFMASTPFGIEEKIRAFRPDPISQYRSDCPARLETLVFRLIEKSPEARPPSAQFVVNELTEIVAELDAGMAEIAESGASIANPRSMAQVTAAVSEDELETQDLTKSEPGPERAKEALRESDKDLLSSHSSALGGSTSRRSASRASASRASGPPRLSGSIPLVSTIGLPVFLVITGIATTMYFWSSDSSQSNATISTESGTDQSGKGPSGKGPEKEEFQPRELGVGAGLAFLTINDALDDASPGDTIIISQGEYSESIVLDDPERLRGIQLTGEGVVNVIPASGRSALVIQGVEELSIENIRFQTDESVHCAKLEGKCDGLRVAHCEFLAKPDNTAIGAVAILGARGSPERPIHIDGCVINAPRVGLVIGDDGKRPGVSTSNINVTHCILRNQLNDLGVPIIIQHPCEDIVVQNNLIHGGKVAMSISGKVARSMKSVLVERNTFQSKTYAVDFNNSHSDQEITVRQNMFVGKIQLKLAEFPGEWFSSWFEGNGLIPTDEIEQGVTEILSGKKYQPTVLRSLEKENEGYLLRSDDAPTSLPGCHGVTFR